MALSLVSVAVNEQYVSASSARTFYFSISHFSICARDETLAPHGFKFIELMKMALDSVSCTKTLINKEQEMVCVSVYICVILRNGLNEFDKMS